MPTTIFDLPDELLRSILLLAYPDQIVSIYNGNNGNNDQWGRRIQSVARSVPPFMLVSKHLDKLASQIPIKMLRIETFDETERTTYLLRSMQCPVQIADFSDEPPMGLGGVVKWTSLSDFITYCPYPYTLLTLRIEHNKHYGCNDSCNILSQCCKLRNILNTVKERMPQCNVVVTTRQH